MDPFLGSPKQKSDRTVQRAFFSLLASVLIAVLWVGMPAVAGAQTADDKKPDSIHTRQRDAIFVPSNKSFTAVKPTLDQPPNSFVQYGDVWGCDDGFTKKGNTCISIFSKNGGQPENSFVQYGTKWGCNDGFRKVGDKCVDIFSEFGGQPENSFLQYGTVWGCNDGFRKEGDKCVSAFTKRKVRLKTADGKVRLKKVDGESSTSSSQ